MLGQVVLTYGEPSIKPLKPTEWVTAWSDIHIKEAETYSDDKVKRIYNVSFGPFSHKYQGTTGHT